MAAGAFAGIGAAQAQDMMVGMQPLEVGGYYTIAGLSTSTDGVSNRGHTIQQNIELEGRAIAELDNGITAGVRIRISGNTHGGFFSSHEHGASGVVATKRNEADTTDILDIPEDTEATDVTNPPNHAHGDAGGAASADDLNISETEVFFTGSFGGLHIGMIEPASQQMTVWAPGGTVPIGGIKSPWFGGVGGMWTSANHYEDSSKIVYFSPSFNGISLGVSYSPDDTKNNYNGMNDNDGEHGEQVTAALSYGSDLMGGSFSAMVGIERTTTESTGMARAACDSAAGMLCDPEGLRYGLSVSIDQISIGGAVYEHDSGGALLADGMSRSPLVETTKSDFGVSWSQGPLMLGVQFGSNDAGGGAESDSTSLNVNYTLGGGVDLGAVYATGDRYDSDADMQRGYSEILLGTMFNF